MTHYLLLLPHAYHSQVKNPAGFLTWLVTWGEGASMMGLSWDGIKRYGGGGLHDGA